MNDKEKHMAESKMNEVDPSQRLDKLDGRGNWIYPSNDGFEEIVMPSLPGSPTSEERMHLRDFGQHVIGKLEASFSRQPYLKSGATQSPQQVFRHFVASARGAQLADAATLAHMDNLGKEFDRADNPREFFASKVRPYLLGLEPRARK